MFVCCMTYVNEELCKDQYLGRFVCWANRLGDGFNVTNYESFQHDCGKIRRRMKLSVSTKLVTSFLCHNVFIVFSIFSFWLKNCMLLLQKERFISCSFSWYSLIFFTSLTSYASYPRWFLKYISEFFCRTVIFNCQFNFCFNVLYHFN